MTAFTGNIVEDSRFLEDHPEVKDHMWNCGTLDVYLRNPGPLQDPALGLFYAFHAFEVDLHWPEV